MAQTDAADRSPITRRIRALADEVVGFALVGGAGIAVNFAVFDLCRALTPLNVLACSLVGTGVAIVGNYFGFRHFTYRDRDKRCPGRQFTLFVVFSLAGLVIENGTLWAAAHELGRQGALESNLVKALGITAAATFRFAAYRTWVFRRRPAAPAARRVPVPDACGPDVRDTRVRGPGRRPPAHRSRTRRTPGTGRRHHRPVPPVLVPAGGGAAWPRPHADAPPEASRWPVAPGHRPARPARHGAAPVPVGGGCPHEAVWQYTGDGRPQAGHRRCGTGAQPHRRSR
ncbi:GtrA family protein [Streptomyces albus]|uniref:GtrA family protein n=1 Tax=Streptomyces albus TaxID=1888 RepID=UPI0037009CF4